MGGPATLLVDSAWSQGGAQMEGDAIGCGCDRDESLGTGLSPGWLASPLLNAAVNPMAMLETQLVGPCTILPSPFLVTKV